MRTIVTSKYQTTIPKAIREKVGLAVSDALDWKIVDGKIVVVPIKRNFLKFRDTIKVGRGDIRADIEAARKARVKKIQ